MKRWLVRGGIAVSVVVALAAAVVVGMVMGAGGIAAGGTAAVGSPTPVATPLERRAEKGDPEPPVALFVGDSYTLGQRASSPSHRWSAVVSDEMGWTELNVADGGTGFVSRYPEDGRLSYAEQLLSVRPDGIDFVVIAGGQNDFDELRKSPGPVFRAVADTYALAARRFPDAQIIAVGPSTPWVVGLEVRSLDGVVRAAAAKQGATYVSLLDPNVVRDRFIDDDGIHLNDAGYAAIASRVVSQIS